MFTIEEGKLFTIIGSFNAQYTGTDELPGTQVAIVGPGKKYLDEEIQVEPGGEPPEPSESRVDVLDDGRRICLFDRAVLETETGERVTLKRGAAFLVTLSTEVCLLCANSWFSEPCPVASK